MDSSATLSDILPALQSAIITSPSSNSTNSARTFAVSTEGGGKQSMSEDEVSSLVHHALRRARHATKTVSPRRRIRAHLGVPVSPLPDEMRDDGKSPTATLELNVSGLSATSGRSTGAPPTTSHSYIQFPRSLDVPKDAEISARPSFASKIIPSLSSKSKNSDEDDLLDISVVSSTALDLLLAPSETMNPDDAIDAHISVDDDSSDEGDDLEAPTFSSDNSSDAIIRRVEEEIANARKAAQDANRRLANSTSGWDSRNAKSTEYSTFHSRNLDNMPSVDDSFHTHHLDSRPSADETSHTGRIDNEPSIDEHMYNESLNNNDSDVCDHQELYGMLSISDGDGSLGGGSIGSQAGGGSFHSAMDVIGEEFGVSTEDEDISQEPDQEKKMEDTDISPFNDTEDDKLVQYQSTSEISTKDEDVNQARGVDATPFDEQKSEGDQCTQQMNVDTILSDETFVLASKCNDDEEPHDIELAFSDCAIKGSKPFREGASHAEEESTTQGRQQDDGDNTTFPDDLDTNVENKSPEVVEFVSAASVNEENKEEDDLKLHTTSAKVKSWFPENRILTDDSSDGVEVMEVTGATYEEASDGSCANSCASTGIATNDSELAQNNEVDNHQTPDIVVVDNIEDTSRHSEIPVEIPDATEEPESAFRVHPIEAEHTVEESEDGSDGAPGSPRRDLGWNKGQDKEAAKKEMIARESVNSQQGNEATAVERDSRTNQSRAFTPMRENKTTSSQTTQQSSNSKAMERSQSPQRAPSPHMMRSSSPVPNSEEYAKTAAVVDQRRALRSRTDNARAAIRDELGAGEQKAEGEKNKSSKVRFRQRYPVPPLISKPRLPSEIMEGNKVEKPDIALYLAKPKRDLQQLLDAAVGPRLPRRSNACGALKVLSMQAKNKLTLVRTAGFLGALVFAADEKICSQDKETAIDARTRAISCILNVSDSKDNRVIVLTHPRLPECLVKCILEDRGEARAAACGALAMLAKSPACREPMSKIENLVDALAMIAKGVKEELDHEPEQKPRRSKSRSLDDDKQEYSDDDKDSQRENIRSFSSDSSSVSSSGDESSRSSGDEEDHADIPRPDSIRQQKMQQHDETAKRARLNACAALAHLSKHCGVSVSKLKYMGLPFHFHSIALTYSLFSQAVLSSNFALMDSLIAVSKEYDNPMHTKCLEILCNLTRFPSNNAVMAKHPGLVDTLVVTGRAKCDADRVWSLRTLQNLSSDVAGKTILANCVVLELLSVSVMRKQFDEQRAAVATLYNLSTEPGAVVPLTNTKNVVATLVHVAHSPDSPSDVRLMACDALATLGLWLQTLAGAGTVPEEVQQVPLPSYATSGWRRWD